MMLIFLVGQALPFILGVATFAGLAGGLQLDTFVSGLGGGAVAFATWALAGAELAGRPTARQRLGLAAQLVTVVALPAAAFAACRSALLTTVSSPALQLTGAAVAATGVLAVCADRFFPTAATQTARGRPLSEPPVIPVAPGEATVFFAGDQVPESGFTEGACFVAAAGGGKTTQLLWLLRDAARNLLTGNDGIKRNMFLFDPQTEFLPFLAGMGVPPSRIKILNPFDKNGVRWALGLDCTEDKHADELAAILLPIDKDEKEKHWKQSAQNILKGVLYVFKERGTDWGLRDVVLVMRSIASITNFLTGTDQEYRLSYFREERSAAGYEQTIKTGIEKLEIVAGLWDNAEGSVSLTDWVKGSDILVLGNAPDALELMAPINSALFHRAAQLLLAQPGSSRRRTWMVLDEMPELRYADPRLVERLFRMGRSRGVCALVCFQSISSMYDAFGENPTTAMLGQCSTKFIGRLAEEKTAEWASKIMGQFEDIVVRRTVTQSKDSVTRALAEQLEKGDAVLPSDFYRLPKAGPQNGVTGFYTFSSDALPESVAFFQHLAGDFLFGDGAPQPRPDILPEIALRDPKFQRVLPWTDTDYRRLNISPQDDKDDKGDDDDNGNGDNDNGDNDNGDNGAGDGPGEPPCGPLAPLLPNRPATGGPAAARPPRRNPIVGGRQ